MDQYSSPTDRTLAELTYRATIEASFAQGNDILFDIDERGARQLTEAFSSVVTILILPPSLAALRKRLVERGTDDEQVIRRRLKRAEAEIQGMASWYDYTIINDRFEDAAERLRAVIIAERCRHNHDVVEKLLRGEDG